MNASTAAQAADIVAALLFVFSLAGQIGRAHV